MSSNLVLDIQKRHSEVFRIRLGARDNRGFPKKLTDAIRVTSRGESVVEAFTSVYGGQVRPWDNQGDPQFEAVLPTTELHVMMLPGQSIFQRWEKYQRSVCERRCTGTGGVEEISGGPCVCPPDIDQRMADKDACNLMTRINVLCPDVEVVGAGSLVSHGRIAAETLPQSVMVAETALSRGVMVPAVLRVVEHKGKKHYVVPTLEIVGVSFNELTGGEHGGRPVQIGAGGAGRALPAAAGRATGLPPLPHELEPGGEAAVDNTAAEPPSSTDVDVADLEAEMAERGVSKAEARKEYNRLGAEAGLAKAARWADLAPGPVLDALYAWVEGRDPDDDGPPSGGGTPAPVPSEAAGDGGSRSAPASEEATQQALVARIANLWAGVGRKDQDDRRHAIVAYATSGRTSSSKDCSKDELLAAHRVLDGIEGGSLVLGLFAESGGYAVLAAEEAA